MRRGFPEWFLQEKEDQNVDRHDESPCARGECDRENLTGLSRVRIHLRWLEKIFLLCQSYMPAQEIHILKNFNNKDLSPWYETDFEGDLETPEWTFSKSNLRRYE